MNLIQMVADHGPMEADALEDEASKMREKAQQLDNTASVIRQLTQIAVPHAKKCVLHHNDQGEPPQDDTWPLVQRPDDAVHTVSALS